jgi:uncharacterized protein YyaL (SSP411 family)
VEHSRLTLDRLLESPLFDSSEGGLHRMAGAPDWGSIQTEKMLAGNTVLVGQLLLALREETGDPARLRTALEQTCAFITGRLGRPDGGFYLAQVAASDDGGSAPQIDRLVLSGPNALAGAALIRAGLALDERRLVDAGRAALDLVLDRAHVPGRGVAHVIEPDPTPEVFLVAQADVALGLVDAYESLGEPRYLDAAQEIADFSLRNMRFADERALRDFVPRSSRPIGLLANPRWPLRGNTRLARALLRLSLHGRGDAYRERAREILYAFGGDLSAFRVQGTETALAVEEWVREPLQIRVHGSRSSGKTAALRRAALRSPWPWTVVLTADEPGKGKPAAEIVWRETRERITDPASMREAILRITGLESP